MIYCGIGSAGVSSYVYVTNERARKAAAGEVATDREILMRRLTRFIREGRSIAIETENQTAWVYEALVAMGAKVTVVNPTKVKLIAEPHLPRRFAQDFGPGRTLPCPPPRRRSGGTFRVYRLPRSLTR